MENQSIQKWEYYRDPDGTIDKGYVVNFTDSGGRMTLEQARLVCGAPKLLEACEAVLEEFNNRYDGAPDAGYQWMGSLMHRLEHVIARAKGEAR